LPTQDTTPTEESTEHSAPAFSGVEPEKGLGTRLRRWIIGKPRDLGDRSIFHRLALVPFLAWVGLGADGLSSSS
jgi:hypothetical protein